MPSVAGRSTEPSMVRVRASQTAVPFFVLTHEPPDPPDPGITFLSGDIGEAVATALAAAGGKNLEILGADVAGQCLRRGLVDEILVYVMPVLLGDGTRFSPRASPGSTWNRSVARGRETSLSSGSTSARSTGRSFALKQVRAARSVVGWWWWWGVLKTP